MKVGEDYWIGSCCNVADLIVHLNMRGSELIRAPIHPIRPLFLIKIRVVHYRDGRSDWPHYTYNPRIQDYYGKIQHIVPQREGKFLIIDFLDTFLDIRVNMHSRKFYHHCGIAQFAHPENPGINGQENELDPQKYQGKFCNHHCQVSKSD